MEPLIVSNSQDFAAVSNPTLAKLLDVDADLAAQEAQLMVQLQELQEKRRSLKTVIGLFVPEEAIPATAGEVASSPLPAVTREERPEPLLEEASSTPIQKSVPHASLGRAKEKRATSTATSRESWRAYVQEEFATFAALPEIVSAVLQRLPEQVFSVRNIMTAIFREDLPQEDYQKVYRHLLTILSRGVKNNQWVRSNKGEYSAAPSDAASASEAR